MRGTPTIRVHPLIDGSQSVRACSLLGRDYTAKGRVQTTGRVCVIFPPLPLAQSHLHSNGIFPLG